MKKRIDRLMTATIAIVSAALLAGCSPPAASLDLITVARQGIASAKQSQQEQNQIIIRQFAAQQAALDAAFDADVRMVQSGGLKNASDKPLTLTGDWVISARKGYTAARDIISNQMQETQSVAATRMDNLQASDEALDMASQLIIQQQGFAIKLQQQLINVQRKLSNGK